MNILDVIKKRTSTRTFTGEYLSAELKRVLGDFIDENGCGLLSDSDAGEKIFLLEKGPQEKKMKLLYGAIQGNNSYLLGITKNDPFERVNYGYRMQKLVLKATEIGLGTCWIGYFDHDYFNDIVTKEGYVVPGLVLIGYPASKRSTREKMVRFSANASKRLDWEKLFFNSETSDPLERELAGEYKKVLEMVRLAPSSSNSQPWRVYFDSQNGVFHFFKKPKNMIYERMGMHELDMGIAMAHFELSAKSIDLKGRWADCKKKSPDGGQISPDVSGDTTPLYRGEVPKIEGLEYILSWIKTK
ncbi:MAG: nitroreductase family protein [Bacteroidales bacterium]|nr:nitroreductase family protein [Bacteroidales bacterium]